MMMRDSTVRRRTGARNTQRSTFEYSSTAQPTSTIAIIQVTVTEAEIVNIRGGEWGRGGYIHGQDAFYQHRGVVRAVRFTTRKRRDDQKIRICRMSRASTRARARQRWYQEDGVCQVIKRGGRSEARQSLSCCVHTSKSRQGPGNLRRGVRGI